MRVVIVSQMLSERYNGTLLNGEANSSLEADVLIHHS